MTELLLAFGMFVIGFGIGSLAMGWYWVNHTARILDETFEDVLSRNGLMRDGLKIVIRGEDALR